MKTVLITGASRGIGKATAEIFAQHGYNIVINFHSSKKEALALTTKLQAQYKVKVLPLKADITCEQEVIKMMEVIKKEMGNLTCLVNNAGIALDNDYLSKSKTEFQKVIATNLLGTFLVTKYASQIMVAGTIINIASDNCLGNGYPEAIDYNASKAGVISLTHDFAQILAPNIRVNAIAPGWVLTPMNKNLDPNFKKRIEDKCLLKRLARPEEIANVIYFLSTAEASFVNDIVLKVNGGCNE